MLFKKGNVQVIYPKGDGDAQEVIELLSIPQHRLKVDFKKRKEFLTAFIPLLIDKEKGHGLSGVAPLARALHLTVDFMDEDGGTNTLEAKSIEAELNKLYHEMHHGK